MKLYLKILSILVVVVLGGGQLLACHHHDCTGNIFFSLSTESEIGLTVDHDQCSHHGSHANHRHGGSDEVCPMHIDLSIEQRDLIQQIDVNVYAIDWIDCVLAVITAGPSLELSTGMLRHPDRRFSYTDGVVRHDGRRAPPFTV